MNTIFRFDHLAGENQQYDYQVVKLSKYNDMKHKASSIFGRDFASQNVKEHTRMPSSKTR